MAWLRAARYLSLFCGLAVAGAAFQARSPLEVIRLSNQEILDTYAGSDTIDEATEARVFDIMNNVTSFESLAAGAIDSFCERMDPAECAEFQDAFIELLRISSVKRLGRYRAASFEYIAEAITEDTAVVETTAIYEGDEVELDYHFGLVDGRWMIVNYVLDGIDTVWNYRKQFTRLLRRETVAEVIDRLRRRIAEYEREAGVAAPRESRSRARE